MSGAGQAGRTQATAEALARPRARAQAPHWTLPEAEEHLRSLELFGMRFGLDRMHRMMTALDSPQLSFDSIHVVGTNGKSSTTRMIAAILQRSGLRTASYTSPHLLSYRERIAVDELEIEPQAFADAIAQAAHAAERVNRTLGEDDHVTQFELLTAAALWQMAEREVQVAVIEAGLGGRYDATAVVDAPLVALTNVELEHTRWLGPTVRHIAEEKLAVLQSQDTLVLPDELAAEVTQVAERVAGAQGAQIVRVSASSPAAPLAVRGAFQQRNFALARLTAETHLRRTGVDPVNTVEHEQAVSDAARGIEMRGRLQVIGARPFTVLDGAHNPAAVQALVQALPGLLAGRPLALVLGLLEDKDAVGMLEPLLALSERAWFTAPPSARALSPAALQSHARQLGFHETACEPKPQQALAHAQRWASERGAAVLGTGSVYLVGELLECHRRANTAARTDDQPWEVAR